jgi:hypothetical protein
MGMFTGYFDDSGSEGSPASSAIAAAGLVAPIEQACYPRSN